MRNLRFSLIALIIQLTVLFNIERLDFGEENVVDIQTIVYVLALLAFLAVLLIEKRVHWGVVAWLIIWIVIYLFARILIHERPMFGGIHTYLLITEMSLLALTVAISHRVSAALTEFELGVEELTLTEQGRRLQQLNEAMEQVDEEFLRSRRHNRPLSVMLVAPHPDDFQKSRHQMVVELQDAMFSRYVVNSLGHRLHRAVRRIDMILEHPNQNQLIIVMPETDRQGAVGLIGRLQVVTEQFGVPISCGIASFPEGAYTFEQLVRQAEKDLELRAVSDG